MSVKEARAPTTEPVPLADILSSLRRLERESGRSSLTDVERRIVDGQGLAEHALTTDGFERYFAVIAEPRTWSDASATLCAMKREGAAAVLRQAVRLYTSHDHDDDDLSETWRYRKEMAYLDASFRELMRGFEADLLALADRYYRSSDSQLIWKARLTRTRDRRG
jgi:hypothetical protein